MKFPNKKFKNFYEFIGAYKDEALRMFDENHVNKLVKISNFYRKHIDLKKLYLFVVMVVQLL